MRVGATARADVRPRAIIMYHARSTPLGKALVVICAHVQLTNVVGHVRHCRAAR